MRVEDSYSIVSHDFYDFVLYPGRWRLIRPTCKWIQNHAVYVSVFLFLFCNLSVCVCFVQWLRRRITDEDPAFCCVWCLGSKRFYFSLHSYEVHYFSYCMSIRCGVVCVRLSSLFALRWCGTQGVSVLFSQLYVFLLSSSLFYSCSLIYHSSISTDMGNKGVFGTHLFAWLLWFCLYPSSGSRVMLFMYLSFGFCSLFVVFCFLFLFSNLSFFH